jgi:hypothetical protein
MRPRRQRADLQPDDGGMRRLHVVRRLPDVAGHLRSDIAAMRAVLEQRRLRGHIDPGVPAKPLRSVRDECRLRRGDAVLRVGRRLAGSVRPMPAECTVPADRANVQQRYLRQVRRVIVHVLAPMGPLASPPPLSLRIEHAYLMVD